MLDKIFFFNEIFFSFPVDHIFLSYNFNFSSIFSPLWKRGNVLKNVNFWSFLEYEIFFGDKNQIFFCEKLNIFVWIKSKRNTIQILNDRWELLIILLLIIRTFILKFQLLQLRLFSKNKFSYSHWLKSTLLLKKKCFDTHIYMKTKWLETNKLQHCLERKINAWWASVEGESVSFIKSSIYVG